MSAADLVAALREPIDQLRAAVGSAAGAEAVSVVLHETQTTLSHIGVAGQQAWADLVDVWSGAAFSRAEEFVTDAWLTVEELTGRGTLLLATAQDAGSAIAGAGRELDGIADEFTARATPLAERVDDPAAAEALAAETRRAFRAALDVVDRLRAVLDGHMQAVAGSSAMMPVSAGAVSGVSSGTAPAVWSPSAVTEPSGWSPQITEANFGDGVVVTLPDGSTATAPNALAASAVRHAMTQLGVPYHWGGTTPGVGLDCSGLTQWAYSEAGLGLPRLAQEQDIGASVSAAALLPGDLAVWDGHVAMVVGNGLMIEAGDPVQLSPIRTTNSGQGFQGFWRPTA